MSKNLYFSLPHTSFNTRSELYGNFYMGEGTPYTTKTKKNLTLQFQYGQMLFMQFEQELYIKNYILQLKKLTLNNIFIIQLSCNTLC